jgi:hypothetical protein
LFTLDRAILIRRRSLLGKGTDFKFFRGGGLNCVGGGRCSFGTTSFFFAREKVHKPSTCVADDLDPQKSFETQ